MNDFTAFVSLIKPLTFNPFEFDYVLLVDYFNEDIDLICAFQMNLKKTSLSF